MRQEVLRLGAWSHLRAVRTSVTAKRRALRVRGVGLWLQRFRLRCWDTRLVWWRVLRLWCWEIWRVWWRVRPISGVDAPGCGKNNHRQ